MAQKNQSLHWLIYAPATAVALFLSLKTTFYFVRPESDSLLALTLWAGFKSGGLSWLAHFHHTPDNWLLSIIPFNFLSFALFGPRVSLVILSGWLVYVLSAVTCGALAQTLGAARAAKLLPIFLLSLSAYAQSCGYVAYPTSHAVTNLYGLATILFVLMAIKTQKSRYAALAVFLSAVATLSDPWMFAAYCAPILCVCAVLILRRPFRGRTALIFITLFITAGVATRLFIFRHIASKLATTPMLEQNFNFLIRDLGGLLNLDPWTHSNPFMPALLSLSLWLIAAIFVVHAALHARLRDNILLAVFSSITTLSAAATFSTITFINVPATNISARFILNAFYLFAVLLGTLIDLTAQHISRPVKSLLTALVTLFIVSGLVTTSRAWSRPGLVAPNPGATQLIAFLSQHALNYGYGPYWGAQANAVTAITGGNITIRPVIFSPATGEITRQIRAQSSPAWLAPADFPARQANFFVLIAADGEQCPNAALCVQGVIAQLGVPLRMLHDGATTILVFDESKKAVLF